MTSEMLTKEDNLRILLKSFISSREDIDIAYIYSNQGLLFAKYGKLENLDNSNNDGDELYGAITALVENLLSKISIEYKIGHYGSGSFETSNKRIIYLEAGSEAILLLVCDYDTNLNILFPIAYLVAEKVAQILENSFDFRFNTLDIPDLNIDDDFSLGLDKYSLSESSDIIDGVKETHHIVKKKNIEKIFKLIVLGPAAVGKTTLVNQFLKKEEIIDYRPTLGISISTQRYFVQGFKDDVIYDLAGQEFFKRVRHEYYKGAKCAFIVYDVTRRETFEESLNFWLQDAQKELGNIPFVLIGNKIDLESEREILTDEGRQEAEKLKCFFIETSALKNINVQDTFKLIGIDLLFKYIDEDEIN
jgi:small GTP-binding protein